MVQLVGPRARDAAAAWHRLKIASLPRRGRTTLREEDERFLSPEHSLRGRSCHGPVPRRPTRGNLHLRIAAILGLAAQAEATTSAKGLEVVVVTARKREETPLDVPMSITAIGRKQIEDLKFKSMLDLAKMSAGLSCTDYGANRAGRLYRAYSCVGAP
jgi:hypothetical protein